MLATGWGTTAFVEKYGHMWHDLSPNCLKDILPKFGQRIKVYRAIKAEMEEIDADKTSSSTLPNSSSQEVNTGCLYVLKYKAHAYVGISSDNRRFTWITCFF